MSKFLSFLVALSLVIIQFHTYFHTGFPYTHDGENHLARFANYKVALKEGQLPPRFAPNLLNHYGYPVFNFNYPLANILSVPFSIVEFNPELTYKILSILAFLFGLEGMRRLSYRYSQKNWVSVVAVILYGLSPYITNIVNYRGSIGELMAASLLPWVLLSTLNLIKLRRVTFFDVIVWSAFLLTHNVMVVVTLPLLLIFAAAQSYREKKTVKYFTMNLLFSLSLVCWFWVPAILEAKYTVVRETGIANELLQHFPTLTQFLFGQQQFGFSYQSPIDSLGFQLGLSTFFILLISCIVLLKKVAHKEKLRTHVLLFTIPSILLILFQLSLSSIFWQIFPFAQVIQFPWRISFLLIPSIPLIWSVTYQYYTKPLFAFLGAILVLQAMTTLNVNAKEYFHHSPLEYDLFVHSTSTQNENRSKTFEYLEIGDWKPAPTVHGQGSVTVHHWTGSDRKYTLELTSESVITEPTMNFPGWRTYIKSAEDNRVEAQYIFDSLTQGRIGFILPPGKYEVYSYFSQRTFPRMLGNLITVVGLIISGLYFARKYQTKRKTI